MDEKRAEADSRAEDLAREKAKKGRGKASGSPYVGSDTSSGEDIV